MDLVYIDESNPVGYDRGDAHILEVLQKMKNSGIFSQPVVSSAEASNILGLNGKTHGKLSNLKVGVL